MLSGLSSSRGYGCDCSEGGLHADLGEAHWAGLWPVGGSRGRLLGRAEGRSRSSSILVIAFPVSTIFIFLCLTYHELQPTILECA